MKRILAIILSLVTILSLAACGKKETPSSEDPSSDNVEAEAWKPDGQVTLYCPYGAGGATDLSLRCLAENSVMVPHRRSVPSETPPLPHRPRRWRRTEPPPPSAGR